MNTQQYFHSLRTGRDRSWDALCTRVGNALSRGGIESMDELCTLSEEKLWRVRNLGEKGWHLALQERKKYGEGIK